MGEKLAVIGASYLQLPLIEKANDMGLETHVFAWEAGDVGERAAFEFHPISIVEKDLVLRRCREIGIDGICSIASDLAMVTVNYVAENMGLAGNTIQCMMQTTNKHLMREALTRRGDPSPKSMVVSDAADCMIERFELPLIVKPTDRSGSRGVTKVSEWSALADAVERAVYQSFEKKAVVEEFLKGREFSVECLSFQGSHTMLAITEKFTTGAPHFIEIAHLEPARLPEEVSLESISSVVFHALDSLGVANGASHAEVMIEGSSVSIVEVGARMGGDCIGSHLVPLVSGVDYVEAVIEIALGERPSFQLQETNRCALVRYLVDSDDLLLLENALHDPAVEVVYVSEIDESRESVTDSSNRPGCFVVSGSSHAALEKFFE